MESRNVRYQQTYAALVGVLDFLCVATFFSLAFPTRAVTLLAAGLAIRLSQRHQTRQQRRGLAEYMAAALSTVPLQ